MSKTLQKKARCLSNAGPQSRNQKDKEKEEG